jgi:hypothetical protein
MEEESFGILELNPQIGMDSTIQWNNIDGGTDSVHYTFLNSVIAEIRNISESEALNHLKNMADADLKSFLNQNKERAKIKTIVKVIKEGQNG